MAGEELKFVTEQQVADIHEKLLARDGGLPGYRVGTSLSAVLERVRNHVLYDGENYNEAPKTAALITFAIAIGHPFNDANKRLALSVGISMLLINGETELPDPSKLADLIVKAAAGKVDKDRFIEAYLELLTVSLTA